MLKTDNAIKPSLFVSYRRTQLARVEPAVRALQDAGIDCFFDQEAIDPLADFPERIRQGIAASHALLAWWSKDYAESDHCMAEFKLAWQHARRQNSDVGRRVWVLNPEAGGGHIAAGVSLFGILAPPIFGVMAPLKTAKTGARTDFKKACFLPLSQGDFLTLHPLVLDRDSVLPAG